LRAIVKGKRTVPTHEVTGISEDILRCSVLLDQKLPKPILHWYNHSANVNLINPNRGF